MTQTKSRVRMADFTVTIRTDNANDMVGFLDMLRYEGGTVIEWNHFDTLDFTVVIRVPALRHQPERWKSFGIYPALISGDLYF